MSRVARSSTRKSVVRTVEKMIQKKKSQKEKKDKKKKVTKAVHPNGSFVVPRCRMHLKGDVFPGPLRKASQLPCSPPDAQGHYEISNIKIGLMDGNNNVASYYVEWAGWPWYTATWEPASSIEGRPLFEEQRMSIEYLEAKDMYCQHSIGGHIWAKIGCVYASSPLHRSSLWVPVVGFHGLHVLPQRPHRIERRWTSRMSTGARAPRRQLPRQRRTVEANRV